MFSAGAPVGGRWSTSLKTALNRRRLPKPAAKAVSIPASFVTTESDSGES